MGVSCAANELVPMRMLVSALQAGAPIGLSATDAWDKAAAGGTAEYAP
jgi:hypothetical protein